MNKLDDNSHKQSSTLKRKSQPNTAPIRLQKLTIRKVKSLCKKANSKKMKVRVRPDDIIAKALRFIQESHLEEIRKEKMSNEDKMDALLGELKRKDSGLTKDDLLGRLLNTFDAESLGLS